MRDVFERSRTPHKFGVVLKGEGGLKLDCPCVYRFGDRWYMLYACMNQVGYETHLASSDDLLRWTPLGKVLPFAEAGWDRWQAAGGMALVDHAWGGSYKPAMHDGRYWMSYLGGALQGYETDPLSIGMAWTQHPDRPEPWRRYEKNPVLSPSDPDARPFERKTLYKSTIIHDAGETLGHPFVMFYNAKQEGPATERIGLAVSQDMVHWTRHGDGPVIDNGKGISGDPQVVRMGEVWVMYYFGHAWKPRAFDTFACSYDLVHWTKWEGEHLIEPSEPWDSTFAHKPWLIRHEAVTYHFYCAVGDQGRAIAVAASEKKW